MPDNARLPGVCRRGDTFGPYPVTLNSPAPGVRGPAPVPSAAGYTAAGEVLDAAGNTLLTLCSGAPDGTGAWSLAASAADTQAVGGGRYAYRFRVTSPTGVVTTLFAGDFPVIGPPLVPPPPAVVPPTYPTPQAGDVGKFLGVQFVNGTPVTYFTAVAPGTGAASVAGVAPDKTGDVPGASLAAALVPLLPAAVPALIDGGSPSPGPAPRPAPGSLGRAVADAADAAINGKTYSAAKLVYSTQNHATPSYVRNTGSWLAGYDLTAVGPWNSTGVGQRAGTAIAPRYVAFANHFAPAVNATIRFVTAANAVVTRTVTTLTQIGTTDICIGTLDSDLPGSITPVKLLPLGWQAKLRAGDEPWPVAVFDQTESAGLTALTPGPGGASLLGWTPAFSATNATQRAAFAQAVASGDSGNPLLALVGGECVLVTHCYGSTTGPDYSLSLSQIAAVTGGTHRVLDLSAYPPAGVPAATTVLARRDTAAGWAAANPVLRDGEAGLEADTAKVKYGDGVRRWLALPYAGGAAFDDSPLARLDGARPLTGTLTVPTATPALATALGHTVTFDDGFTQFGGVPSYIFDGSVYADGFVGSAAALTDVNPYNLSGPVSVAKGGTGATTAAGARAALGVTATPAGNRGVTATPASPTTAGLPPGWRAAPGAAGDGVADDTAAIQAALTAAGAAGGGVVCLGAGDYRLAAGTLAVPANVTLLGTARGPLAHTGYRDGAPYPTTGGTRLLVAQATAPAVSLTHNSTLEGVCVYHPGQSQTAAPPTPYPAAIKMRGVGPTVRNVELLNPYIAVDVNNADGTLAGITQRPTVEGVTGQPLYRGLVVGTANDAGGGAYTGILDCGRFLNVHFNPWWSFPQAGTSVPATLYNWQAANGIAFDFGDTDESILSGCFAYGYLIGLRLRAFNRGSYLSWHGGGLDICGTGVQCLGSQATGVRLSGLGVVPTTANGGAGQGVAVSNGVVMVSNCSFWNLSLAGVCAGGRLQFTACDFGVAGTHVVQSGPGKLSVTGGSASGGLTATGTVTSSNVMGY